MNKILSSRFAKGLAVFSFVLCLIGCSSAYMATLSTALQEMNKQLDASYSTAAAAAQINAETSSTPHIYETPQSPDPGVAIAAVSSSAGKFKGTPYTVLPAGTDGTAGKQATYVAFGDWPQTIKAESVTVDESQSVKVGAHTYFKGSDGAWYMKRTSVFATGAEGPEGYRYSDGTRVRGTKTLYFKVEPIKWRVVTNNYNGSGKKLLLSEYILTNIAYYDCDKDATRFDNVDGTQVYFKLDKNIRRNDDGSFIQHNNYEHSRLRAYLNGISYLQGDNDGNQAIDNEFVGAGFLQTAFTSDMQAGIAVTTVDNSIKSTADILEELSAKEQRFYQGTMYYETGAEHKRVYYPSYLSNNTKDKVFILSRTDVLKGNYGFTPIAPKVTDDNFMDYIKRGEAYSGADIITTYKGLARRVTDFCKANGVNHPVISENSGWYLRTPLMPAFFRGEPKIAQFVAGVNSDAGLEECGVAYDSNGVVPAICVNY